MFLFNELKQVHLEITSRCQASCPMCARNIHGGLVNPWLEETSWSLEDYKTIINAEVINQLESVYFCGNYGDPLMNKDLLEMCRYTVSVKPTISIRIHTNGSIQNTKWWEELASVLPKNHSVIFSIDGLEDTNHLYRIGTFFNKIIDNAKAFIGAGGNADWAFLIFKHNEHQVSQAEQFSKELGFRSFDKKNSNRFLLEPAFEVYDNKGNTLYNLETPSVHRISFISRSVIDHYKKIVEESEIDCQVIKTKEVYIDAKGRLFPCCFIGNIPYNYFNLESEVYNIKKDTLDQFNSLMKDFGGIEMIDAKTRSVKEIINSETYQTIWNKYWRDPKLITCARACGKNSIPKSKDQFIKKTIK